MTESNLVERLLSEQRARMVAGIMGYAERELYPTMTDRQKLLFRRKVMESVGVFYDFVRDALRATSVEATAHGVVLNDEAMRLLGEIHGKVHDGSG